MCYVHQVTASGVYLLKYGTCLSTLVDFFLLWTATTLRLSCVLQQDLTKFSTLFFVFSGTV